MSKRAHSLAGPSGGAAKRHRAHDLEAVRRELASQFHAMRVELDEDRGGAALADHVAAFNARAAEAHAELSAHLEKFQATLSKASTHAAAAKARARKAAAEAQGPPPSSLRKAEKRIDAALARLEGGADGKNAPRRVSFAT